MITEINSSPVNIINKWPMLVTWKYKGTFNSVTCNTGNLRDELLHKLVDAQVRPDSPKIIREIKYIKAKNGIN